MTNFGGRITPSGSPGCRLSNIELLRIISMFLVVALHALFYSLGKPEQEDLINHTFEMTVRTELEAFCLVCVNVFVMISGWFGIKASTKGIGKFIYQWLFLALLVIAALLLAGYRYSIKEYFSLIGSYQYYWFIYAYLFLYAISPVLNSFALNASRQVFKQTLVMYWAFMFVFGWIEPLSYIGYGLSPILFIGSYLTARYIHLYPSKWTNKTSRQYFVAYFLSATIAAAILLLVTRLLPNGRIVQRTYEMFMSYGNPLHVLSSVCLLLAFVKMPFQSKVVNKLAASCFAVYLVQCNAGVFDPIFKKLIIEIHSSYSGLMYPLVTMAFILFIFIISFIADQLRIFSYKLIFGKVRPQNLKTNK